MNSLAHSSLSQPARSAVAVVLFNPSDEDIDSLAAIAAWDLRVVAVVNAIGPAQKERLSACHAVSVMENAANLGLARALNQAIGHAMDAGARYVLMLDQDSRPTLDMIDRLAAAAAMAEQEGRALACVAPLLRDRKADVGGGGGGRDLAGGPTFATSGTMLTRRAWQEVGPMLEPLFIDGIDHEWCFRAQAAGFETVLVRDAVMQHDMGEAAINLMGRFRPVHRSPIRHYFIVRNILWLAGKRYIPIRWRMIELLKLFYRIPCYVLFSTDKRRTLGLIGSAIADGIGRSTRRQPVGSTRNGRGRV